MRFDHRRILATAIARLRAKLKYRPVVFELMPAEFTLTELQHTVEAISGRLLHKQNFRRLVEMEALVAVSAAALTIYDMCKAVDRGMVIENVQLEEKSGGQSGHYVRGE